MNIKNKILFLFSACLIGFALNLLILIPHLQKLPASPNLNSSIYLILTIFGYQGILWTLIALLCIPLFLIIKNYKFYFLYLTFLIATTNLIYFINTKIYSLYKTYLDIHLIKYLYLDVFNVVSKAILSNFVIVLFVTVIISVLIYFCLKRLAILVNSHRKFFLLTNTFLILSILISFVYSQSIHAIADIRKNNEITFWSRHLPYYRPLTMKSVFKETTEKAGKERANNYNYNYKKFSDSSIKYPKDISCDQQKSNKKNIIIIAIDSARANMLTPTIMPNVFSHIKKNKNASIFDNHFSGGNATSTGLFSLFYAIPGTYYEGFANSQIIPVSIQGIVDLNYSSKILFGAGTDAISLYKRGALARFPGVDTEMKYSTAWKNDIAVTEKLNKFLTQKKQSNEPFFSFVLYESAHGYSFPQNSKNLLKKDYMPSADYLKISSLKDPAPIFNRYLNSMHFLDEQINKVFNKIEELDLFKNSIVIFTSDHGEEFNDNQNNYWGHNSAFSDAQLKIPLVIFDQKYPSKKYSKLTSHFDIFSYIFDDYLKCDKALENMSGTNIFKDIKRKIPIIFSNYSNMAFRENDYTYVFDKRYQTQTVFDSKYRQVFNKSFKLDTYKKVLLETSKYYK